MGLAGEIPLDIHPVHNDTGQYIVVRINNNGGFMQTLVRLGSQEAGEEQKDKEREGRFGHAL